MKLLFFNELNNINILLKMRVITLIIILLAISQIVSIFEFKNLKYINKNNNKFIHIKSDNNNYIKVLRIINNLKMFDTITNTDFGELHIYNDEDFSLPESINKFRHVQILRIFGPVLDISQIYNFMNLEILFLLRSKVEHVDVRILNLSKLKQLIIIGSELKSLPREIGRLSKLETLFLDDNNHLSQLPDSVSMLTNLKTLDCDECKLSKLPNLERLKNITRLDFSSNLLEEIPESVSKLESLEMAFFNDNKIKFIPKSLGNLRKLKILLVAKNNINDIPQEFRHSRVNITL